MKLSKKQQEDLETNLYFLPANCVSMKDAITEDDIKAYFLWSDKGDKGFLNRRTAGTEAIRWGKTYRELFITDMLRDLDTVVYIWDIARDDPDMPEKVLLSLGGNRLNQFKWWKKKFAEDPDCNIREVLDELILELTAQNAL